MSFLTDLVVYPNVLLFISFVLTVFMRIAHITSIIVSRTVDTPTLQGCVAAILSMAFLFVYGYIVNDIGLLIFGSTQIFFSLWILCMYVYYRN